MVPGGGQHQREYQKQTGSNTQAEFSHLLGRAAAWRSTGRNEAADSANKPRWPIKPIRLASGLLVRRPWPLASSSDGDTGQRPVLAPVTELLLYGGDACHPWAWGGVSPGSGRVPRTVHELWGGIGGPSAPRRNRSDPPMLRPYHHPETHEQPAEGRSARGRRGHRRRRDVTPPGNCRSARAIGLQSLKAASLRRSVAFSG